MISKSNIKNLITHKNTILLVSALSLLFSIAGSGALVFIGLILFSVIVLWSTQWNWNCFGLKGIKSFPKLILKTITLAVGMVMFAFFVRPILEHFFSPQDLSSFEAIRGNLSNFLFTLVLVWVVVAFFEEFVYRGYIMLQWERLLKKYPYKKLAAVLLSAIIFGFAHSYQGTTGIIFSGIIGVFLGIIFYLNNKNLWLVILIHGLVDSIYISLVYLNYDLILEEMIRPIFG